MNSKPSPFPKPAAPAKAPAPAAAPVTKTAAAQPVAPTLPVAAITPVAHRSSGRLGALVAGAAVVVAGTAGILVSAAGADGGRATSHVVQRASSEIVPAHWERNIVDTLNRRVVGGFGDADLGGTWLTSRKDGFGVSATGGRVGPLAAGAAVHATLNGTTATDETVNATFVLPSVPRGADTSYVAVELRRQSDGDSYRVRVRMDAAGHLTLQVARLNNGRETPIGDPAPVAGIAGGGRTLVLTSRITGTSPVHISTTVRPEGAPSTRVGRGDDSAARVASAGRFGILVGNARKAGAMTTILRSFTGYRLIPATVPTDPTPTDPAPSTSSSDPSATPTDPAPSPTDPAPSTSSDPTTPAPTTPAPTTTSPTPPTPPAPTGGRGAGAPGSASYPVPSNAIFVAPSGSDSAAGTLSAPLRTVTRAVAVAPSGATIVLRGGNYHESVSISARKQLTIQNYPGEAAWFDGTVPVDDWSQSGSVWIHNGWTSKFDSTPGTTPALAREYNWLRPGFPMAAHPDQVYVDGVQLKQVGSAAAVVPGTFYSDYANNRIVMGTNPNGHSVRAADLQEALTVWSTGSVLRGIGFRRYATSVSQAGALSLRAPNQLVQNVTVTDMATVGIHANSQNQRLDHLTVTNNGLQGIKGIADRITISNSVVTGNDSEMFNTAPVAAGIKLSWSEYDVITNNLIADNHGNGLWFDMSSYGMTVSGNDILRNEHIGLSIEISKNALVVGNTISGTHWDGIRVCDSSDVRIWNNVLLNNEQRNIDVAQDNRTTDNSHRPYPTSLVDWKVRNVEIRNNVFIGSDSHVHFSDPLHLTPSARHVVADNNLLSMIDGRRSSAFTSNAGKFIRYTAAAWPAYAGTGQHNVQSDGRTADAMAGDMNNTSYAANIPADVAALLGQTAGDRTWGRG